MTLTLESDDADTYLYLREGEARSGEFLYENDDYDGIAKSQIQETLAAGTYTVEATTYGTGETGSFTLTVSGLGSTGATPPGPEPTDECGQTLPGDGSVSGEWAEGCDSEAAGRGYARHYGFTLAQESEVTITLESDDADTYLYLRVGEARSGGFLYENDDYPEAGDTDKSQIQETLSAGNYTIEATTYGEGETGSFILTVSGLGTTGATPPGSPATDREALVALYNATDGPNWTNNTGWLTNNPIGEWHGVVTDASGRITELWLSDNRLSGEIPAELGNLSSLEWLWLSDNQLTGEIPAELGRLSNLSKLKLSDNQLTGNIPSELGGLPELTFLNLPGNQLSGEIPPQLGNLSNLEWLGLRDNQLTGCVPDGLRHVPATDFDELGLPFCSS